MFNIESHSLIPLLLAMEQSKTDFFYRKILCGYNVSNVEVTSLHSEP